MSLLERIPSDFLAAAEGIPTFLFDPLNGELFDPDSIDELIDFFQRISTLANLSYSVKSEIARHLAALTKSDERTRRLAGGRRIAKIEMPGPSWSSKKLKEIWFAYPDMSKTYLRIAAIEPNMREIKKLRETTGNESIEAFKGLLFAAEMPGSDTPKITIEK